MISTWAWVSHNFHRNTEDLLNFVIQFDESSIFKDYLVHFPAPASKVFLEKKFLMLSQKNVILIFRGMELSSPKTKKCIIFPRKNFSYILGNRTFLKNLFFRGNFPSSKNKKKPTLKKFLIFREMELFSPKLKKLFIFQKGTFRAWQTKISYVSLKKVLPTFLDDCWSSRKIKKILITWDDCWFCLLEEIFKDKRKINKFTIISLNVFLC